MPKETGAMLNRREFLGVVGAAVSCPAAGLQDPPIGEWGSPVFDLHFHMRGQTAANVTHLDGAAITRANLPTRATGSDQVRTTMFIDARCRAVNDPFSLERQVWDSI
jgi:hypothetical protein